MSATTHPGYAALADPLFGLRRKEGKLHFLFFRLSMRRSRIGGADGRSVAGVSRRRHAIYPLQHFAGFTTLGKVTQCRTYP
jgi:hypothetical protein